MPTAVASHDFTILRQDRNIQVTYKKGKLGLRNYGSMLWPSLLLSIFLAYRKVLGDERLTMPQEKMSMGIFYTLSFTFLIPLGILIVLNLLRRNGQFSIGPEGIELKGKTYPWSEIKGIYMKSPSGQRSEPIVPQRINAAFVWSNDRDFNLQFGTTMAVASAVNVTAQAATMLSRLSGQEFVKSIQRVSHKICFRYGKDEVALARGLSPKQAQDLMQGIESLIKG
jgi:hypothetical protein